VLSIIVVNWNTKDVLRCCLDSIRKNSPKHSHEVIVVDNASSDGSADMVASEFPDVVLIRSKTNLGYAAGNNLAFSQASGDWLLTLNPDTEFVDGSLDLAVDSLASSPDYGALGAKQILPDGSVQRSVRGFPTYVGLLGEIEILRKLFNSYRLDDFDYEEMQEAQQPMGTFLLFRKQALAEIGDPMKPFDERFPIFFNEVDLLYRLNQAGWKCLYNPKVRIWHVGGESTKQVRSSMIWESYRSLVRYMRKHHGTFVYWPALAMLAAFGFAVSLVRARGYHRGFGH
jgi:GT2 family glycosyltransferase